MYLQHFYLIYFSLISISKDNCIETVTQFTRPMLETVLELAPVQISLYVNSKNTVSDSPLFHTSSYEPYLDLLVHFISFICFLVTYLIPGCVWNAKYRIHDENRRRAIENTVVLISDAFGHLRTRRVFLKQPNISIVTLLYFGQIYVAYNTEGRAYNKYNLKLMIINGLIMLFTFRK